MLYLDVALTVTQAGAPPPLGAAVQVSPADGSVFSHFPRTTNFAGQGQIFRWNYLPDRGRLPGLMRIETVVHHGGRTWFDFDAFRVRVTATF